VNKFLDWIEKPTKLSEKLTLIGLTLIGLVIYAQIKPFVAIYIVHEPRPERYPEMIHDMILVMIFMTPFVVLFEELVGRVLTTLIAVVFFGRHQTVIVPLIIISSVIFSMLHALGPMSIQMALFTYMPLGITLHIIYLKCGGWKGGVGTLVGLFCCWALHLLYNYVSYFSMVLYAQ